MLSCTCSIVIVQDHRDTDKPSIYSWTHSCFHKPVKACLVWRVCQNFRHSCPRQYLSYSYLKKEFLNQRDCQAHSKKSGSSYYSYSANMRSSSRYWISSSRPILIVVKFLVVYLSTWILTAGSQAQAIECFWESWGITKNKPDVTWSNLILIWESELINWWVISLLHIAWPHKSPISILTFKISLSLHAAIIFAYRLIILYAYPIPFRKPLTSTYIPGRHTTKLILNMRSLYLDL